jgi:hypothetical protein
VRDEVFGRRVYHHSLLSFIPLKIKNMEININRPVRIDGLLYRQVETGEIEEGDLVLDLYDGTYGFCDMRKDDKIAIRHDWVVEVAIPISRVRKLVHIANPESEN